MHRPYCIFYLRWIFCRFQTKYRYHFVLGEQCICAAQLFRAQRGKIISILCNRVPSYRGKFTEIKIHGHVRKIKKRQLKFTAISSAKRHPVKITAVNRFYHIGG